MLMNKFSVILDKSERNIPNHNITMNNNVYPADEKAVSTTGSSKYFK